MMPWVDIIWTEEAVEKVAEHGLSPEEVEHVIRHPTDQDMSRSTGRPVVAGYTPNGRYVFVVYEWLDDITVVVVTAYELED